MADIKKPSLKADGKKQTGRPSAYTVLIGNEICNRLSDGESLRKICLSENMPSKTSVFRWLENNKEFRDQYARAREIQADSLFDECLDIADEVRGDIIVDKDGNERTDNEAIQRSKLRIDTRKWIAGKLRPKVYGDKQEQEQPTDLLDKVNELINKLPS